MKITFISLIISFACFINAYASDDKNIDIDGNKDMNGQIVRKLSSEEFIPLGREVFGYHQLFQGDIYAIENYANGKKDGLCIVFSDRRIYYTMWYKDDVLDGLLTINPNDILSASVMVKDGLPDGECIITFAPYKYSWNSTASSSMNYEYDKIGVPEELWIRNAGADFQLKTVGLFREGKRFSGKFLSVSAYLDLRIVSVITYEDYNIVDETEKTVYKLIPYALAHTDKLHLTSDKN